MEKSWKNILSSLWEPCINVSCRENILMNELKAVPEVGFDQSYQAGGAGIESDIDLVVFRYKVEGETRCPERHRS